MRRRRSVILVQPGGRNWIPGRRDLTRAVNAMIPVGIASLSSWLEQHGISTRILDGYAHPEPLDGWVEAIRGSEPDFLGITSTTSSFPDAAALASAVKAVSPGTRIVLGGVHASALRERVLREHPEFDFVVVGEGEETFLSIIERNGHDLLDVPGTVFMDRDTPVFTGLRKPTLDLDSLPFPAYDKLTGYPHDYPLPLFNYPKAPTSSIVTSRGCPYSCSYCDRSVFGRSFRYNSPRYMMEHLHHVRSRWGIRHVTFYDDIFTANRRRVEEFCDLMAAGNPGVTFNCAVRSNQIDEELVRRLAAAGCWQVSFGVESGDEEVLRAHRRGIDLDDTRDKVHLLKRYGLRVKGLFIVGLPGESEASVRRTIDYACSVPFDEVNVSKFTPFPGAPLYDGIGALGDFDEDWGRMNLMNFVFVPDGMTIEGLEDLYREFIKRFYQRRTTAWTYAKLMATSPVHLATVIRHAGQLIPYLAWVSTGRQQGSTVPPTPGSTSRPR